MGPSRYDIKIWDRVPTADEISQYLVASAAVPLDSKDISVTSGAASTTSIGIQGVVPQQPQKGWFN